MKAKFVLEYMKFERRGKPLDKIGIGQVPYILSQMQKYAKEFEWREVMIPKTHHPETATGESIAKWIDGNGGEILLFTSFPGHITKIGSIGVYWKRKRKTTPYKSNSDFESASPWATKERWEKLMGLNESLEFERGQDPKKSMGIGLERDIANKWEGLLEEPDIGSISLDKSLNGTWHLLIFPWENSSPKKIYNKASKYFKDLLSPFYNKKNGEIYIKIRPQFVGSFIKAYNIRYSNFPPLKESFNFERGQNPKKAMDIGLVKAMAKKFENFEWDYRILATWIDKIHGKYALAVSYEIWEGWNRIDKAVKEIIGDEFFEWPSKDSHLSGTRNYFIKPEYVDIFKPEISEGINFERGQDPIPAMGIGQKNNAYILQSVEREYSDDGPITNNQDYLKSEENLWTDSIFDDDVIIDLLDNWEKEIDGSYYFWINAHDAEDDMDPEYIHAPEMEGDWITYKGKYWKIPHTDTKKKYLGESMDFERGVDTLRAARVGATRNIPKYTQELASEIIEHGGYYNKELEELWLNLANDMEEHGYYTLEDYYEITDEDPSKVNPIIENAIKTYKWALGKYAREYVWKPEAVEEIVKTLFHYKFNPMESIYQWMERKIDDALKLNWEISESSQNIII